MDGFGGPNMPTLPMAGMGMGLMNPEMAMLMNQEALAMGLGPTDLAMAVSSGSLVRNALCGHNRPLHFNEVLFCRE